MARNGKNLPPQFDVIGNCAAHICSECGGAYAVSAYANHQWRSKDAGWRVCPHCYSTEATIWFERTIEHKKWDVQKVYLTAQRVLTPEERDLVRKSKPTARGNLRLEHKEKVVKSNRFA